MDKFIARLVKEFEDKKLSRRQLVQTIKTAAITFAAGETAAHAAPANSFKTIAVNHISYTCPDYTIARDFYQHLMGMGVVNDNGRQCLMPFGASASVNAGTHLLPRGYPAAPNNYTPSGTIMAPSAPRGQGAGNAAAANAATGAARGGRGGNAANGQQQRPQPTARIDHIAFTCKNWDKARVKSILEAWGLYPTEDGDSYHVRDPFGYNLQISGPGMAPYGGSSNNNGNRE